MPNLLQVAIMNYYVDFQKINEKLRSRAVIVKTCTASLLNCTKYAGQSTALVLHENVIQCDNCNTMATKPGVV